MNLMQSPYLFVIAGPTAVGKTALSMNLADYIDCPIISADSRQFYKELSVGTAKPTNKELETVKHYFINNKSITELYSAGEYEKDVIKLLNEQFFNNPKALLVGGSGMYIDAVCKGLDDLPRDLEIRNQLNNELQNLGINHLQKQLQSLDPICYQQIDHNNPQRLIRALEICKITNEPYSKLLSKKHKPRSFKSLKFLLHLEKEELNKRIELRVNQMIDNGLFKEVENVLEFQNHNALNTVGYKEIFSYLNGLYSMDEAVFRIKSNTKKYAKRQMTWFKRDKDFIWVDNHDKQKSLKMIKERISETFI